MSRNTFTVAMIAALLLAVSLFTPGQGRCDELSEAYGAKARGVPQFLAFVNSPPARMTRSGFTNGSRDAGSTNLKEGYEPVFARYLAIRERKNRKSSPATWRMSY